MAQQPLQSGGNPYKPSKLICPVHIPTQASNNNEHYATDNPRTYFCRGCGKPLRSGGKEMFHPECLRRDKQRRTQESRRRERTQFELWLKQQRCPHCKRTLDVSQDAEGDGTADKMPKRAKPRP